MQIQSVGIDLGKTTFHLVALGAAGKLLVKKKFMQKQLLVYTANLQASLIGLEACAGAHFLGRALRQQGHDVRLIPAQFVKPFVKSNKNDFVDAEAIAEAVDRKNMRFVPIKTDDQLDLQAIHRVRDRLVARRTSVINQIRAFLLERGLVFEKKPAKLKAAMAAILENADADLTPLMRNLIDTLWSEWKMIEQQVEELNDELERISAADAGCTRIRKIPGIGPVIATAIVAAIGNGAAFRKGREFAALARHRAAAVLDRWEGEAVRHQQARQPLPAQGPHPRRTSCCAADQARRRLDRSLARSTGCQSAQERRRRCHGKQVGPDRVGGAVERQRVQAGCCASMSRGKDAFGLEALRAPTFPHHDDEDEVFPPRSA